MGPRNRAVKNPMCVCSWVFFVCCLSFCCLVVCWSLVWFCYLCGGLFGRRRCRVRCGCGCRGDGSAAAIAADGCSGCRVLYLGGPPLILPPKQGSRVQARASRQPCSNFGAACRVGAQFRHLRRRVMREMQLAVPHLMLQPHAASALLRANGKVELLRLSMCRAMGFIDGASSQPKEELTRICYGWACFADSKG